MIQVFTIATVLWTLAAPPATPFRPVEDVYHGVPIVDGFRWLENGDAAEVKAWSAAQNAHARDMLAKLPGVADLRTKFAKILGAKRITHSEVVSSGGRLFALRRHPPKQQRFLVRFADGEGPERVLLDPNEIDATGQTAIDWYLPSPDAKLVAVSLSKGGSESGDLHLYEVGTGKRVDVVIPRVHGGTAGGSMAWSADGRSFFYTRYPRTGERPAADVDFYQSLWLHRLGSTLESDSQELGSGLPRIAEIQVEVDAVHGRVLATVQNGDGGEFRLFLRSPEGKWKQIADYGDKLVQAAFSPDGDLFAVSRKDAPKGKILKLSAADPNIARAKVVVPEGVDSIVTNFYLPPGIRTVLPTATRIYVTYQLGGPSVVRCFTMEGKPAPAPKQPEIAAVHDLSSAGGDDVLFSAGSFVLSDSHCRFHAAEERTQPLGLDSPAEVDFDDVRVVREFAVSRDGTKVPVNILIPKTAKLDGSNPCHVNGYGGYGINVEPGFKPSLRVMMDHGFIVAVANLRGGGEYGESWHAGGNLTNKQNVFDDFAAVLKHLAQRKYTSSARLAIEGGSNGGLLMGATLTQHPDLMKCVVSHVGIYDMLRVELSSNGAFNIPEFGSVRNRPQFEAMRAYSPYHAVKDGAKHPPVLFLTGANDPRVDPMQSRKMTARLQAAGANQIYLRTTDSGGHGLTTPLAERIEEAADVHAFVFSQLAVDAKK